MTLSENDELRLLALEHGPCTCEPYTCGEGEDAGCPFCRALQVDYPCPAECEPDEYPDEIKVGWSRD